MSRRIDEQLKLFEMPSPSPYQSQVEGILKIPHLDRTPHEREILRIHNKACSPQAAKASRLRMQEHRARKARRADMAKKTI